MLFLIGLFIVVYWIGTKYGDHAGAIAVAGALVLIVVLILWNGHVDNEAWRNRQYWWWKGKRPPGWEREDRQEERHERMWVSGSAPWGRHEAERQERDAAKKREQYLTDVRNGKAVAPVQRKGEHAVCHYCGRYVEMVSRRVLTVDGWMREYHCPNCGQWNLTKI